MASKRKKFRPTKIARDDQPLANGYESSDDYDEDPSKRIQRFLEEESEDTPDACYEKLKWSPVKLLGSDTSGFDAVECQDGKKKNSELFGFPHTFTNGHVPANLKFHQLMKEEVDSINQSPILNLKPTIKFTTEPNQTCNSSSVKASINGHLTDRKLTFHQVLPKKSPAKRAKPNDDDTPRYSCTKCKYVTNRSDHYKRHLMTHSADKPLKCTMCSYGTGRSDHYKRHLQRHGLSEQEVIDTCFRNGLKLKNVSASVTTDPSHKMKEAKENMQQPNQANPNDNQPEGKEMKRYKCDSCNYMTDKSSHFHRHRNSHTKTKLNHCDKCNKSFKTLAYIRQHRCLEREQRRCPKCGAIFIDRTAMLRHINNQHKSEEATLLAEIEDFQNSEGKMSLTSVDTIDLTMTEGKGVTSTNGELADKVQTTTVVQVIEDSNDAVDLTSESQEKPSIVEAANDNSDVIFVENIHEKTTDLKENDNTKQTAVFMPNVPSTGGNLACIKCGEWFNKLNEYSSHTCVS